MQFDVQRVAAIEYVVGQFLLKGQFGHSAVTREGGAGYAGRPFCTGVFLVVSCKAAGSMVNR